MSIATFGQAIQTSRYCLKAAPPTGKAAMPVVGFGHAVNAHPYLDVEFFEQPQIRIAQADAVGLDPQVDLDPADCGLDPLGNVRDQITAGQQRLTAVQNQRDSGQAMRAGMLSNSLGGPACDLD